MRVSLVTETYSPQVNGVSRTLGQLVRVLREAGDEVRIIHPDYGTESEEPGTVTVPAMRAPFYRELYLPFPRCGRVGAELDQFRPDITHIATEATLGLTALSLCRKRRIPVVSSFHTNFHEYSDHYHVGWFAPLIGRYLRWFHNKTSATYVPSRATIQHLQERHFHNLHLWPRGVDRTFFRPDRPNREQVRHELGIGPGELLVGHVSRIAAEKNVAYLGAALAELLNRFPGRVRVLIVGDGPARAELEQKLGAGAHFAGYQTGERLADLYSACDLFAFASKTETFGNVVLEAMASGLPVVAIKAGGPAEIVENGVNGLLVDPDAAPIAMTDGLAVLVHDPERRNRLARAARCHAERQSWDQIMLELRESYVRVVEAHGRPRGTRVVAGASRG